MRTINTEGLELIKHFEGLRLTSYQDGNGIWTIGYGHTLKVEPGMSITQDQADLFLRLDLDHTQTGIMCMVDVPLSDNQFSALCSLVFNIGLGHFKDSTCLSKLNSGDYASACNWIGVWNKIAGKESDGLMQRRHSEQQLFLKA